MTEAQEKRRALQSLKAEQARTFESAGGSDPREITAEQIASLEREIERAPSRP